MTHQQLFEAAVARLRAGELPQAEALCRQILCQRNDAALHLLGLVVGQTGRLGEAVELISQAIAINPGVAAYHNNLGEAHRRQGQFEAAGVAYRKAIALSPGYGLPYQNLANVLMELGRASEAVGVCRSVVELNPGSPEARENLAAAHVADGNPDAAMTAALEAVRLSPRRATAHVNLGAALLQLGKAADAVTAFRTAISLDPNLGKAHWNLGLTLLVLGDWKDGWAGYEWRWKCDRLSVPRGFPQPLWRGEPLSGRTILLYAEQGMGDVLQFVRYAPMVARRGGRIILECHPELRRLLKSVAGIDTLIAGGQPLPAFDVQCPLLNLPGIFETRPESTPADVPYLMPDDCLAESWQKRLTAEAGADDVRLRVGVVWAGSPGHKNDRNRSITLARMAPLGDVPGVHYYSLQRGPAADQASRPPANLTLIDFSAELSDLADTAGLVRCLDLVITVDTAVAHLAGAMGKRVWVLLPHAPDWRWMLERADTPWYPSMRLFRQSVRGNWGTVLQEVADALRQLAAGIR